MHLVAKYMHLKSTFFFARHRVLEFDVDSFACTTFPLPAHSADLALGQAIALDGSIYCFGMNERVRKYNPETRHLLTLPSCKKVRGHCYLATLVRPPSPSSSVSPLRDADQQPLHLGGYSAVIQDVQHPDEAAAVDADEAAAIVAEQWAQQAELNLGSSSNYLEPPGLLMRLSMLEFRRQPAEFYTALLEGPELQSCREQMQGLPCRLDSGALVFLEPFQYNVAIEAAMRQHGILAARHVITSERFEPSIMQAVRGLRSRLNVRLRSKQTILEPLETEVVRTFLDVPDFALRSIASVTHSTTDAHGRNPRTGRW